jgi:hypothetical protein
MSAGSSRYSAKLIDRRTAGRQQPDDYAQVDSVLDSERREVLLHRVSAGACPLHDAESEQ